ncbi:lipid II:glycine glycyltransferase FemX [Aquimarina sp. 2201CG5-10]|uniref:lipid II:glycine glycyltransferase FemX n=1 Tax=Aquimarina callyspongiae TaxID=3098150 RepID=UPI002AB58065|nr:peptidoglycan bridge formation glycyltransferase FemA/FemB family protein [Aquimarina sp. 2201CG5-10]MDY8136889.1 peptidoglycan bridge formation glycyltransferase FemA/FemB family protein [Aquimarina sp. 2201CG5-10]
MMTNTLTIHDSVFKLSSEQIEELMQNESANFFQTIEALHFFNTVGLETFSYAIEYDKKITAFVAGIVQKEKGIKSSFTSRAIIYGGPIISKDVEKEHIAELFKTVVKQLKHKVIYIETRNLNNYSNHKEVLKEIGFEYHPHLNFHVTCDTQELAKKRLSSSKLRQIKKSLKEGAEIKEATTESEIADFYEILSNLYKTKVKTPLPDLFFFTTLWSQRIAKIFLVFFNNEVIGGIVCPFLKDKVIYEWYVCGKDGVYKNIYPSILATWSAIQYACENQIPRFDFMGAGKPDEDYGVREFKSKFGGELVEHGRFVYVANPFLYNLGKQAVKALKKW